MWHAATRFPGCSRWRGCGAAVRGERAAVGKVYRVAYLALVADEDVAIVKQRLHELGYREGTNLIFDVRSAEGELERLPQLAAAFVRTNPDVIVAGFGTATAKAAQTATGTIPIIFTGAGDPLGTGIVRSLSRPGANITGLHTQAGEINGKRLQVLDEIAPGIRDRRGSGKSGRAIHARRAQRLEGRRHCTRAAP